ncbi:YigZ family protein [Siminovitchia sp. 179-K 8D1 HS]|uniref:YigZ family protein n=1 Tax=Siminovitchia sp. 179-K 8D1 HS TaxID=3142385 RepID=UPI0039A2E68F
MLTHYLTVKTAGSHEIIIHKSRFIAHVNRAETEEKAQAFIQSIKKEHWNATHNCSAYLIGDNDQIQKANDDGEPGGTAGVPMLEVLKKRGLKDTVVVVTRYFGGIKLGSGGLIRAYGRAASEGIDAVGAVERRLMNIVEISIDYTWLGKLENELRNQKFQVKDIRYSDVVKIEVYVESEKTGQFSDLITELTNGQADISYGPRVYLEIDVN